MVASETLRAIGVMSVLATVPVPAKDESAPIDRQALVTRHSPVLRKSDCLSPLSAGNGEFAFTVDVSGLQTFEELQRRDAPTTQGTVGWHSMSYPAGYSVERFPLTYYDSLLKMWCGIRTDHLWGEFSAKIWVVRIKFRSKILIMNHVERFRAVMNFNPVDRLPRWEWAMWWDQTIERWHHEGLPSDLNFNNVFGISQYFGLDPYMQFWFSTTEATIEATQHHVEGVVANMDDYLKVKARLYPDHSQAVKSMHSWAEKHRNGEVVVWATLEGFFWFPRTLMDIGRLSYAFYDQPELVHAINGDLLEFNINLVRQMAEVCVPTFMTLAEDMSYNHGPMISKKTFDEFLAPYYKRLIPLLKELDIIPIVDTDGDVTELVPWLEEVGILGVLPLERQAGVDGMLLREKFPKLRMIGHFNKMVMNQGQQAIRSEFERLRPLMRTGGFIPSVDHQTPPGVSLEEYRCYLQLLEEYNLRAAKK